MARNEEYAALAATFLSASAVDSDYHQSNKAYSRQEAIPSLDGFGKIDTGDLAPWKRLPRTVKNPLQRESNLERMVQVETYTAIVSHKLKFVYLLTSSPLVRRLEFVWKIQ